MQKGERERKSSTKNFTPSSTLYIKNLNEKIKKNELRRALYLLFTQFGPVLDVIAQKTTKMRGQAFVVFPDIVTATNAMRECQNFYFFEKNMEIQYAKGKSEALNRLEGHYQYKTGPIGMTNPGGLVPGVMSGILPMVGVPPGDVGGKRKADAEDQRSSKRAKPTFALPLDPLAPPNKVLFVQNLPEECSEQMLTPLFQKYPGFMEVRLVPGGKGMAFVEFQNELESSRALAELQGFRITLEHPIALSYKRFGLD
eukprot:TRINITY_DN6569_c0_g1_i5.p1 TRINITY_DN6569_c0_g1~~TRINITY_DN6569_c0_g1_i5.p1  ORF type:complete len:255 (-),score=54.01 TRINITY_DN6569_c0_g1_i5:123-887(-)